MAYFHQPVLLDEVLEFLQPTSGKVFLDCTLGGGGHAFALLEASSPDGELVGLDLDPYAHKAADERLAKFGERVTIFAESYLNADRALSEAGFEKKFDGILLDLGLSAFQISSEDERGFSFRTDTPLDMRFSPDTDLTAAEILNRWPFARLAEMFRLYGEIKDAGSLAKKIVKAREVAPFKTTQDLVKIVTPKNPFFKAKIHPATLVFQALRITVNSELDVIKESLPRLTALLKIGGRIAVISYHSLEDRIVKDYFKDAVLDCVCDKRVPVCRCDHRASLKIITKKPIVPSPSEISANPKARSAKLRVAEKIK